jgi:hypothetical protein
MHYKHYIYLICVLTLPWFYAGDEDYVTDEGLIKEIEPIAMITNWTTEEKSGQLIGTLEGITIEFTEDSIQYWTRLWDWEAVKNSFVQIFRN